jgi:hypothetical protein
MEETIKALLYLVRVGLLADARREELPARVDWPAVFSLSLRHGVGALAADGLQKLQKEAGETEAFAALKAPAVRMQLMQWVGGAMKTGQIAERQEMLARELADVFAQHGLRTVVLKGMALSRCYPHPKYRYSCDLDCFLLPDHQAAFEEGNRVAEGLGLKVDRDFYKNSTFVYKGLMVENHQFCTPIRGNRRMKRFEQRLEDLLERPTTIVDGAHLELPDPLFTALFITEHAQAHMLENAFSLKQVCDWAVFRRQNFDKAEFERLCREFGYWKMAVAMDHLADLLEGSRDFSSLSVYEKRLLFSIFEESSAVEMNNGWKTRVQLVRHALKNSWKYKAFTDTSMLAGVGRQVLGFLFDRKPSIH